jgi:hypothetical protein
MEDHRRSDRFENDDFSIEILESSDDRSYIERREEHYISHFNTFENGLNESRGGKGWGHNDPKFTTRGFRFSEESKLKMSSSAKQRAAREGYHTRSAMSKKAWSNLDYAKRQSDIKKGKRLHKPKVSDDQIDLIRSEFEAERNALEIEAQKQSEINIKLGRFPTTAERLFAKKHEGEFPISMFTLIAIISNKRRTKRLPSLCKS